MEGVGLSRIEGVFGAGDIEIDHYRFLAAPNDNRFHGFVGSGIEFLVRYVRWNVDKIAGAGFVDEFEMIAPAETGASANHVNDGFQFTVVVRTGLGVRMHDDGSGP